MTNLLLVLAISISVFGKFYVMNHKKKLSDENLIEFEKTIKPKIITLVMLSIIPMFLICAYLFSGPTEIKISYFIICGLILIILNVFGYFKSRKIINQSPNAEHFKYILNYFIFTGLGMLLVLSTVAYSLKDFWVY